MQKNNKFYVTTPIYYVTSKPHLGSLYTTILADVASKWNKLLGKQVFFLTGTDEHGQKIAQAAEKVSMSPQQFVDDFIESYKHIWKIYNIDYSRFIRTTDTDHVKTVQLWISELIKKDEIYKSVYKGWYCVSDEMYLTEKESDQGIEIPICPNCKRPTTQVTEESYFFRLSKYQDKLLKFYKENSDFVIPKERLNEVIKFVESGLKDLSISRTTIKWGIPFPGDEKHVVYVWADALLNYLTGIGYMNKSKQEEFDLYWPADLQMMGKEILRFHAVYWPAFLMASDLPMPKKLLVHGWITINQQKMSKSFGNVVDPQTLHDLYGPDQIRYYCASQLAITQDSEYSTQDLEKHISNDLANDLGNLLNRMVALAIKNDLTEVPEIKSWSPNSIELYKESIKTIEEFSNYMDKCSYHLATASLWKFIAKANAYFHSQEPWKLADNKEKFNEVISATCHSLKIIGTLLWPIMPIKMMQLLEHIGQDISFRDNVINELEKPWTLKFKLKKGPALFQKIESTQTEEKVIPQEKIEKESLIDITDLAKIQLLVGTIEQCELVPKSDKLLKLKVNFGDKGIRQILAGVQKFYKPEDLIGKQGVFVYNLAPRKLMGIESQGMMLFVQDANDKLQFVTTNGTVPNGNQLR